MLAPSQSPPQKQPQSFLQKNFIKELIKKYNIDSQNQIQLAQYIKQRNIQQCGNYVKKKNREQFKGEIQLFIKKQMLLENNVEEDIHEIVYRYGIQKEDIIDQMSLIYQFNFNGFIKIIPKTQQIQLQKQLTNLLLQYYNKKNIKLQQWLQKNQQQMTKKLQQIIKYQNNKKNYHYQSIIEKLAHIQKQFIQQFNQQFSLVKGNDQFYNCVQKGKAKLSKLCQQKINLLEQLIKIEEEEKKHAQQIKQNKNHNNKQQKEREKEKEKEKQQSTHQTNKRNTKALIQTQIRKINKQLKQKEQQIIKDQQNGIKDYSFKQKFQIFNDHWQHLITKLQNIINNDQPLQPQLISTKTHYQHLLKITGNTQTNINLILSQDNIKSLKQISKKQIKKNIINKIYGSIWSYDQFMVYTGNMVTVCREGQYTDAKLQYFCLKDFLDQQVPDCYFLSKAAMIQHLNIKYFIQKNYQKYYNINKTSLIQTLQQINSQIKSSYGVYIIDINKLKKIYDRQTSWININVLKKMKIQPWIKQIKQITINKVDIFQFDIDKQFNNKFIQLRIEDIANRENSGWVWKSNRDVVKGIVRGIKWLEMLEQENQMEITKTKKNQQLCEILNNDLSKLNIKLYKKFDIIKQIFQNHESLVGQYTLKQKIFDHIETYHKNLRYQTQNNIRNKINELKYFNGGLLKQKLRMNEQKNGNQKNWIIGKIYESQAKMIFNNKQNDKNRQIKDKLKNDKNLKNKIFLSLKKISIQKFIKNILQIVQNTIKKWKREVLNFTIQQIYALINHQISVFNNDLNQISHKLTSKMITNIHNNVIYMICKLQIKQELQKRKEMLETQKKKKDNKCKYFMRRVSNNINKIQLGQVQQYLQGVIDKFKEIIDEMKLANIQRHINEFKKTMIRRTMIQRIDEEIFGKQNKENIILQYIQNQFTIIQIKYQELYEKQFIRTCKEFYDRKLWEQFLVEFRKILSIVYREVVRGHVCMDEQKKICVKCLEEEPLNTKNLQKTVDQFHGLLMEKLDTNKNSNNFTKQIIKRCNEDDKLLKNITNFPKFLSYLHKEDHYLKSNYLQKICKFDQKIHQQFYNKIRVIICKATCPCCKRICSIQQPHKYHQCLYGHQMIAFTNKYLQVERYQRFQIKCRSCKDRCICGQKKIVKVAHVKRCEQLKQDQSIFYNGNLLSWRQIKKLQREKPVGGWLFDDITESNTPVDKQKFIDAWKRAGPLFCDKYNIEYADYKEGRN